MRNHKEILHGRASCSSDVFLQGKVFYSSTLPPSLGNQAPILFSAALPRPLHLAHIWAPSLAQQTLQGFASSPRADPAGINLLQPPLPEDFLEHSQAPRMPQPCPRWHNLPKIIPSQLSWDQPTAKCNSLGLEPPVSNKTLKVPHSSVQAQG